MKPARWLALDLLRFCAVFLMVQGHTFTTLLDASVRAESWYPHHRFVHGYTAPMFLFAAGLAFGYTTFRRWDKHTQWGPAARKRFKRYALLLVLGYGLHLPVFSLTGLLNLENEARIRRMLQVDVLQHIGVSLAICQLLIPLIRRQRVYIGVIGALSALSIFLAPVIWSWNLEGVMPVGLAGFVNSSTGSIFPLVPWAGFIGSGIVMAYIACRSSSDRPTSDRLAWPLLLSAVLVMGLPVMLNRLGVGDPYGAHNFWKTSPYYFFWRLGNVLALLTLLCFVERAITKTRWFLDSQSKSYSWLATVKVMGQETLTIYVAHLMILHGSVLNRGMSHALGRQLTLEQASLTAFGLLVAMGMLAWMWSSLKKRKLSFNTLQFSLTGTLIYFFLSN